jgi:hypothetical protein
MNGFIKKTAAACCFSAGLVSFLAGCDHYRDLVDPCYPERWNSLSQHSARDMLNAQSDKGHILEQTVWNWHFEPDPKTGGPSDRLNGAGMAVLQRISRTLPAPDFQLFLQNAQDIPYVEGVAPEKLVKARNDLNERRAQAIQRFMATEAAVHGGGSYQVAVHDFSPTSLPALYPTVGEENILKNIKTGQAQNFTAPSSGK